MMNLSPFRRRSAEPNEATLALIEATEQLCRATSTLAVAGQALVDAQQNHACLAETLAAQTQALTEQVQLWRDRDDRIDGRLDAFERWIAKMRREAPSWLDSDLRAGFTQFLDVLASHYPPGRDPDAPFGGGRH